jgi:hypothetical protein
MRNIYFNREQILSMKSENKQNIVDTLSSMPCALEADDVADFCSLAQYYALKTPGSFQKVRCTLLLQLFIDYFCFICYIYVLHSLRLSQFMIL